MNDTIKIALVLLAIPVTWFVIGALLHWLLNGNEEAETLEEKLWAKQGQRSAERERALRKARLTGDCTEYNALKARHDAEFVADCRLIHDGIDPYQAKQSPAPAGKTVRAK